MSRTRQGAVAIGLVLLALRPVAALRAQGPGHVVEPGGSGYGPVPVKVIDQRGNESLVVKGLKEPGIPHP